MKIRWLPRRPSRSIGPKGQKEQTINGSPSIPRLTISFLTFGSFEHAIRLLPTLCEHLYDSEIIDNISLTIVMRNNNPKLDSSEFDKLWNELIEKHDRITFMLFNDGFNVGYGAGHNLNFDVAECDYFLVLNDDVAFPDLKWLMTGIAILDNNPDVGAIGAADIPSSITPCFGNGTPDREWHRWPLRYVEGSIALFRASVFASVGKFDPAYEWALCEDSDLSFRIQALGYRLEWIDIPHQHWRASSFNRLPGQVKGAILEHNRSVFFSKWNTAIARNRIGSLQIYDLWSDGIGDVFLSCLHLASHLRTLTDAQRAAVVVNTSVPDIARLLLGEDIVIETIADRNQLVASHSGLGVRSLNSLRGVNYGLPFNLHALLCAALGIPVAGRESLAEVILNRKRAPETNHVPAVPDGAYCVLHLESERPDHEGRTPSPAMIANIASCAAEIFSDIVLVGRNKHLDLDGLSDARVVDLRGRLSFSGLFDVIASADSFVGIDSFPAHIAQVLNIKSVLFFGSIHPLFRVLSAGQTWPITKELDCIGCYHTALEPAVPFCMRRDAACTTDLPAPDIRAVMQSCLALDAFDWRALEVRALALQQKFLMKMFYHPESQRRFLNVAGTPQLATTNLIEAVIEQIRGHVLEDGDHGTIASSAQQLDSAKREMFRKDVQIQSMIKLIADLRAGNGR